MECIQGPSNSTGIPNVDEQLEPAFNLLELEAAGSIPFTGSTIIGELDSVPTSRDAVPLLPSQKRKSKRSPRTNNEIIRHYLQKSLPSAPTTNNSQSMDPTPGPSSAQNGQNQENPVVTSMLTSRKMERKKHTPNFYGRSHKLTEDSKAKIETTLEEFMRSHNREITFQSDLSRAERKWLHEYAKAFGLKSASHGVEPNRRLTLTKKDTQQYNHVPLQLSDDSVQEIEKLLRSCKRRFNSNDVPGNRNQDDISTYKPSVLNTNGTAFSLKPRIAPQAMFSRHLRARKNLPIYEHRNEIVNLLFEEKVKVICIKGATGSGKTTQVPQYILEESQERNLPVQIVSTVPRRIAAISLADRVAEERGENPGSVVGYQIRFESNISPSSLLTFCTTGVLLRWFSTPDQSLVNSPLQRLTHLILDEVHERDKLGDFLITILKRVIGLFPNIQLILMGADLNLELFTTYFGGPGFCPVLNVEGRLFPIASLFLEDFFALQKSIAAEKQNKIKKDVKANDKALKIKRTMTPDQSVVEALDMLLDHFFKTGEEGYFTGILHVFTKYNVSYNYRHSKTGVSLMALLEKWHMIETTAIMREILSKEDPGYSSSSEEDEEEIRYGFESELKEDMTRYKASHPDSGVIDFDMVMQIISYIHSSRPADEAILVFLPGFEDLNYLSGMLRQELDIKNVRFVSYILHSSISSKDQKAAFKNPDRGTRKILISTNIAETSLTFDDVVHVIDSGRVKEKSFNSTSRVSTLQNVWISKASANQRQGRAGRCRQGWCYRLYTRAMYESFKEFTVPELLRLSLSELCLAARIFLPLSESVASFFKQTPEPPADTAVNNAIEDLKYLGAFTSSEELTPLGYHLAQLPVDPNLGKALLLSVIFHCLDPMLTIVAFLSHRDPFNIPITTEEKDAIKNLKRKYAMEPLSDLSVLPALFTDYDHYNLSQKQTFCRRSFLNPSAMSMISNIRRQLLKNLTHVRFVKSDHSFNEYILNSSSQEWAVINGVLTSCLLPNICQIDRNAGEISNGSSAVIRLHPSSITDVSKIMCKSKYDWIIYTEMSSLKNNMNRIQDGSTTTSAALLLFGSPISDVIPNDDYGGATEDNFESHIDLLNWIRIEGYTKRLNDILTVRKLLAEVLNEAYSFPALKRTKDTLILTSVKQIMQFETRDAYKLK